MPDALMTKADCRKMYYLKNRGKISLYMKERFQKPHVLNRYYLKQYGISKDTYDCLLAQQEGRCAICLQRQMRKRLGVDHDHVTDKVRGLLCDRCNMGIAFFNDDQKLLIKASGYLSLHSEGSLTSVSSL